MRGAGGMNRVVTRDPSPPTIRLNPRTGMFEDASASQLYEYDNLPRRRWQCTGPTVPDAEISVTQRQPKRSCPRCAAPVDGHGRYCGQDARNTVVIYGPTHANTLPADYDQTLKQRQQQAREKARRCTACKRPGAQCNCRGRR